MTSYEVIGQEKKSESIKVWFGAWVVTDTMHAHLNICVAVTFM